MNYYLNVKNIIFLLFIIGGMSVFAQQKVTGLVTTKKGIPLPGVSLIQKGTSNGEITDFDGVYEMTLSSGNDIIVFSYLGFESREVKVGSKTIVNISLDEDIQSLDEIVVVGYGQQKRSVSTGAISSIKSKELEDNVFTSISETLQGRAAGVLVLESSGEPGSGLNINIRGTNSLTSGQPLYVIDGIPLSLGVQAADGDFFDTSNPLASLNPNDVESIEILKDASATAIYGSRASNGVILITTKSAKAGKTKVTASLRNTVSDVSNQMNLMNAAQYNETRNYFVQLQNPDKTFDELLASGLLPYDGVNKPLPEDSGEGTDFIDLLYRQGFSQNYQLSVSGGTEKISQLLSANFDNTEGVILGSKMQRGNFRYNGKIALNDKFSINANLQFNVLENKRVQTSARTGLAGVTFLAFRINPNTPAINAQGDYNTVDENGNPISNPIVDATEMDSSIKNKDVIGGFTSVYKLTKDLNFTTRLGLNHRNSENIFFANKNTSRGSQTNGRMVWSTSESTSLTTEGFLNYKKSINKKHELDAVLGVAYEDFIIKRRSDEYTDFTFDELGREAIQLGQRLGAYYNSKTNYTIQSGFFRLSYALNKKYIFDINGRADGTSKFINGKPWGFFPSAAFAWNANREQFIRELGLFSLLKFRVSFGETGSQSGVGPLATQGVYALDRIPLGDDSQYTATFPAGISNPDLTWETSTTLNLGLDMNFMKNRFRTTLEWYKRRTEDLLTNLQIPSQSGFRTAPVNAGIIENTGIEVSISGDIIRDSKFRWSTNFNWTRNITTLEEIGLNEFLDSPSIGTNLFGISASRTYPGDEIGQYIGYNVVGLIQPDDLVDYQNGDFTIRNGDDGNPLYVTTGNGEADNTPGMWKFEDVNGDGIINIEDRTVIGNPNPDFFFGWNNTFSYGKFRLSMFWQGSFGNDILNINKAFTGSGWSQGNGTEDWFNNRWTLDNQHNDIKWPSTGSPVVTSVPTSVLVEDGSYARLKNLTLRYTFPEVKGFKSINVFLTGTNLVTITNYTGQDPEVNTARNNSPLLRGIDYSAYPRAKSYTLGLNLNF
jgi:TonB-linked SusC/RagA family outer membrane protein